MTRAFRSEWLKLRRPGMLLGGLGGMLAFSVLAVILTMARASAGPANESVSIARLSQPDGFASILERGSDFLGIFALGIVAVATAQEYSHGTLRSLLVREPRRIRLLAGKTLANLVYVCGSVVVASVVALLLALVIAPGKGITTSGWLGSGLGSTASTIGNMALASAGFGVFGALLALVVRAPAPAVIGGVAWIIPAENLLTRAWPNVGHWLPGQQLSAVVAGGNTVSGYTWALALGLSFVAVAAAASGALFRVRDVSV
ncbi:MAG TPA: ABC transporter permease [Candidatus Dormibacteraeota bacterium]|nr:ABC transporter permease [Candidatus Dormibacteraeota bacterium]